MVTCNEDYFQTLPEPDMHIMVIYKLRVSLVIVNSVICALHRKKQNYQKHLRQYFALFDKEN